jgi:glycerol-1-phosphate dehydrogenase [NAD(P)+]
MTCAAANLADLASRLTEIDGASPLGISSIDVGQDALQRLPAVLAGFGLAGSGTAGSGAGGVVAVLAENVRLEYRGADLRDVVARMVAARYRLLEVSVPTHSGRAHADAATIEAAARQAAGAGALVTVGSGTLADIGKAASQQLGGLPHVIVQTALSVNGFADDQSVLIVDNVKRTVPTRWPDALIADTEVLAGAPARLNAAGVGDLMAMFTAPADWQLATLLNMGSGYSPRLVGMVRDCGPDLLRAAARLADRDPQAIECVARILTLSGVTMGAAGTTAPSSGAEHTISHLIEMAGNRLGRPSAFHGAQVGASTVLAALVWQRVRGLLTGGPVRLRFPADNEVEPVVRAAFDQVDPTGTMSEECWRLYRTKLARWRDNRDRLARTDWAEVQAAVAPLLLEPGELVDALASAGSPTRFAELDPPVPPDTVHWALANCHLMRDRFTVVDLAWFLGGWNADVAQDVLAEAGRLGAGL